MIGDTVHRSLLDRSGVFVGERNLVYGFEAGVALVIVLGFVDFDRRLVRLAGIVGVELLLLLLLGSGCLLLLEDDLIVVDWLRLLLLRLASCCRGIVFKWVVLEGSIVGKVHCVQRCRGHFDVLDVAKLGIGRCRTPVRSGCQLQVIGYNFCYRSLPLGGSGRTDRILAEGQPNAVAVALMLPW